METGESSRVEIDVMQRPSSASTSYGSLPHKTQLLILMLARFADSLATSSIHAYMFFQIQHLSPNASAAIVTTRCGILVGCRTGAHVCTGFVWGRLADKVLADRKTVLVFGLLGSSASIVGYGFSRTFHHAVAWQVLDGGLNATVAMVRCMTAELNSQKRHRVKAFTLLPLFANIGAMLGPLLGGFLVSARLEHSAPVSYPYALPNVCAAIVQASVAVIAILCLTDTFQRQVPDRGKCADLRGTVKRNVSARASECLPNETANETTGLLRRRSSSGGGHETPEMRNERHHLPFRAMWTPNVVRTMLAQFIVSGHLSTFTILWAMLLSLPVASSSTVHLPFQFAGGMGLQPRIVGVVMSAFAFAGIILQILIYPGLQGRWGTVQVWRAALCLLPPVYLAAPFCALVPLLRQDTEVKVPGSYPVLKWSTLLIVLILFAAGRTGVVPATSLLINDCTPHPSVRGTIHTTGVICSNLSKSVFPPMALAVMAFGLRVGVVGLGFWFVAVLALLSIVVSLQVREGTNVE